MGAYEHGHGHTCIWWVCIGMKSIWLHGVGFIPDINSYAHVQWANTTRIEASV